MDSKTKVLKIALLTEKNTAVTCQAVSLLIHSPQVRVVGILLDGDSKPLIQRFKNFRRNLNREGFSYLPLRLFIFFQDFMERLTRRIIPATEVRRLLENAFPQRFFNLADLAKHHQIPLFKFANLNQPEAGETLKAIGADLGVVLGTRVLKRSTFAAPPLGTINLHKGKVPEYRGQPPGFWELYDGQQTASVTVHFIDDRLDTGDLVGEESLDIHPKDNPVTLRRKLDNLGNHLLARCVAEIAEGRARRRPQSQLQFKPRRQPTRWQQRQLYRKTGLSGYLDRPIPYLVKTIYNLFVFYSGFFNLVRFIRRLKRTRRACVLLYHRVNDQCEDVLTTKIERFAEHLVTLQKFYIVKPVSEIVARVRGREKLESGTVAITFDDCYKDVYTEASRLLQQAQLPSSSFVSSGFVDTNRVFPHDSEKYPIMLENFSSEDLRGLIRHGFEIGSHTVNHVDLGRCTMDEAAFELMESKKRLEQILSMPVKIFSFPFGRRINIRPEVVDLIRKAGYEANFSAHGGYVNGSTDCYDIPRVPASDKFRPLDLIMEIEGLSLGVFKSKLLG